MKRLLLYLFIAGIFGTSLAQPWSGVVGSTRAADWSTAGVEGGIPSATWTNCTTASCNTLFGGSVTATTITNAIGSAPSNTVVRIPAGSFSLAGFQISRNNVTVRGAGADQTFLTITSAAPTGCGTFFNDAVAMCTGNSTRYTANWTGGYSQGTTQITLSSAASMTVGQPIFLTQSDDTADWPASGDMHICESGSASCSAQGGGATYFAPTGGGSSAWSGYKVTAINGTTVTLDHGIILSNYRSAQSPVAFWYSSGTFLQNSGLEDLSVNFGALTGANGVLCVYCFNTWERGVRSISPPAPTQTPHHWNPILSYRTTARDNYWYGPNGVAGAVNQYSLSQYFGFNNLWENNINQAGQGGLVTDATMSGSVFAYNFFPGRFGPGVVLHAAGEMMNLYEGNVMLGFYADVVHGTHAVETVFRNAMIGGRYSGGAVGTVPAAVHLQTGNRFFNIIGNVMGDSYINTYETTLADSGSSAYVLGWRGSSSGIAMGDDSNVKRTLFRWGNWDKVTNATRWCGNSANTGWSTACASTSEVPSAIPNFSNPIPATETLPASFYLPAKPSWWPSSKPWPAIGPDVTGGNITALAGHAYTNPAADCFLNIMSGPSDGSGSPLSFNATTCYAQGASSPTTRARGIRSRGVTIR